MGYNGTFMHMQTFMSMISPQILLLLLLLLLLLQIIFVSNKKSF